MKDTPEQARAIRTTGEHISVSAGAGSGKTRVLVDRIVYLLEHKNVPLSQIVAITFTRKAASEMKERLRKACHEKAPEDDAQAMTKWRDILYELDTARITTIDSFCSGLLREHALWMQDDPDYVLMSESDRTLVPKRIAQETLVDLLNQGDESAVHVATELGIEQTVDILVGCLKKPNLHDLLLKYAALDAGAVAALWDEKLEIFIQQKLQEYTGKLNVLDGVIDDSDHPYEQYRVQLLGLFSAHESLEKQEALIDGLAQTAFTGRKRKTFDADLYAELVAVCKECREFLKDFLVPSLGNEDLATAQLTFACAVLYQHVHGAYHSHKRKHSLKDFSDLLCDALTLLETQPKIRDQVADSIRYLMIDEFQDTNPAQWVLAQQLMKTPTQSGPELFIVGDAKQSIYRFRDADVSVFKEAQSHTTPPILLNKNFRTVPNVMDRINDFFAKSQALKMVADPWEPLHTHRPEAPGDEHFTFLLNTVPDNTAVHSQRQSEAVRIADHILTLCTDPERYTIQQEDHDTGACTHKAVEFGDIALLFRKKSAMYLYENELKKKGVPYIILGGSNFFQRQEITDITNLLHVVLDPWHEEALYAWLRSPMVALSDDSLVALGWQHGLARQFYSATALPDEEQQRRLQQARDWVELFRNDHSASVSDRLQRILIETQIEAILLTLAHGEQRVRNVQKLLDTAREMTQAGKPHLHEFLHFLKEQTTPGVLESDAPLREEQNHAVTLMTIHASKGLEFPVVILPDISMNAKVGSSDHHIRSHSRHGLCIKSPNEQDAPAMYTYLDDLAKAEDRDEDARVFYVAMTRAQDHLILSGTLMEKEDKKGELSVVVSGKKSWLAQCDAVFNLLEHAGGSKGGVNVLHEPHGATATGGAVVDSPARETLSSDDFSPLVLPESDTPYLSITAWLDAHFPGPKGAEDIVFDPQQYRRMQRGTLVHRYLEVWDFDQESPPEITGFLGMEYPLYVEDPSMIETLEGVVDHLRDSEIYPLLRAGAPLQRELPFTLFYEEQWVSGTIDVLTATGIIVDYKTGAYRKESLSRYEAQLRLYAHAIHQITGAPPAAAWLYFVDSGQAHEVGLG